MGRIRGAFGLLMRRVAKRTAYVVALHRWFALVWLQCNIGQDLKPRHAKFANYASISSLTHTLPYSNVLTPYFIALC